MDYLKKILEIFNEDIVTIFKDTINTYLTKRIKKIDYNMMNIKVKIN